MSDFYGTTAEAEWFARRVREYWERRGCRVKTWVERQRLRGVVVPVVCSDLVNGLPPELLGKPESAVVALLKKET